jgi:hypothetical protein
MASNSYESYSKITATITSESDQCSERHSHEKRIPLITKNGLNIKSPILKRSFGFSQPEILAALSL